LRKDHRPYQAKRIHRAIERRYLEHFIRPQLDAMGQHCMVMKPWNLKIYGAGISIGHAVHVITGRDRPVRLTTWGHEHGNGRIDIGNYVLLCPGVRLDSATQIEVADNCMIAAGAYLTDSDWHDIYDRTRIVGGTAKVTLEDNVWIGDGAIVCKGVSIGRNSVIGAGSVVTHDIPANVIAAGNPARVIRPLDPDRALVRREQLLADPAALAANMDQLERYLLGPNTWLGWLRALLQPSRGD